MKATESGAKIWNLEVGRKPFVGLTAQAPAVRDGPPYLRLDLNSI
jgi:hypothetical protein